MNIEELEKLWAEDSKIDETNLVRESNRTPELHSKYYKLLFRAHLKSSKLKSQLKELEKAKMEYYNGTMASDDLKERGWKPNPLKILRTDIDKYIQSDKDIIELSLRIDYQVSIEKFLEDIVRQINTRNFILKNTADFLKFQAGGY